MLLLTGGTGQVGPDHRTGDPEKINTVAIYRGHKLPPAAKADPSRVKWVRCDLNDAQALMQLGQRLGITSYIHAAAVSNEAYARPNPTATVETNISSTTTLLGTARIQN